LRLALSVVLAATLLPAAALANRRIRSPLRKPPAAPARRRRTPKAGQSHQLTNSGCKKGDVQSALPLNSSEYRVAGNPTQPAADAQTGRLQESFEDEKVRAL